MAEKEERPRIEYAGIALRFVFLALGTSGLVLSIMTLSGCDMFAYEPRVAPEGVTDKRPDRFINITYAELGLFNYDVNFEGCRELGSNVKLSWQYKMAQVVGPLAFILASAALFCIVLDFFFCRFPGSRLVTASLFTFAFVTQALTMAVFSSDLCKPNYKNGPYPCSPLKTTWYSVTATALFFLASIMACCVPRPLPLYLRVKDNIKNEKQDACCVLCRKIDEDPLEEEEEEDALLEDTEEATLEEMEVQRTQAAVITALTAARSGKLNEIERELTLLRTFRDETPEELYNAKVTSLIQSMPDPGTYDEFTKTGSLVQLQTPTKEDDNEGLESEGGIQGQDSEDGTETRSGVVGSAIAKTCSGMVGGSEGTENRSGVVEGSERETECDEISTNNHSKSFFGSNGFFAGTKE